MDYLDLLDMEFIYGEYPQINNKERNEDNYEYDSER